MISFTEEVSSQCLAGNIQPVESPSSSLFNRTPNLATTEPQRQPDQVPQVPAVMGSKSETTSKPYAEIMDEIYAAYWSM